MPRAPMLPPEVMQQAAGPDPTNMLIAAADLHANGQLGGNGPADQQRSMPRGVQKPSVGFPAPHRKNPRHTKSTLV